MTFFAKNNIFIAKIAKKNGDFGQKYAFLYTILVIFDEKLKKWSFFKNFENREKHKRNKGKIFNIFRNEDGPPIIWLRLVSPDLY
jgi:hypothetical protein